MAGSIFRPGSLGVSDFHRLVVTMLTDVADIWLTSITSLEGAWVDPEEDDTPSSRCV